MFSFKTFEDLEYFLDSTNFNFDVIAINETRITKNKAKINHIDLTIYSYGNCPMNPQLAVLFYTLEIIFRTKQGMI